MKSVVRQTVVKGKLPEALHLQPLVEIELACVHHNTFEPRKCMRVMFHKMHERLSSSAFEI